MNKQKEAPYQFYKIQAIVWISLISATHTSMGMGPSTGVWETNLWKRTQERMILPPTNGVNCKMFLELGRHMFEGHRRSQRGKEGR